MKPNFSEFEVWLMQDITSAEDQSVPLESLNLPTLGDPGPPTVQLFREQLVKFRARYSELLWFAARHSGCEVKELTRLHLIADLLAEANAEEPNDQPNPIDVNPEVS